MLPLVDLWLKSYGRAGIVVLFAAALGYPMTRRILRGPASSVLSLLLGFAALSLAVCLLSWVHLFSSWTMGILGAVAALASLQGLHSDLPRWWARRHWPSPGTVVCFSILGVVLVFFSVLAIYPSTAFDATSYHLPLARDLVVHHGLVYDPYVRFSFFPQANESVFAVMLLITRNPVVSAALEFAVLAIGTLLIPVWFKAGRDSLGAGLIGAVVLLSSPMLIWVGTTAFIDAWTMVFVLASLVCGLGAAHNPTPRRSYLLLMGIFLGEAVASKYSAFAFGVCVVIAAIIAIGVHRDLWRGMLGALAGFLVVAVPWYAWTFHTTGDPLYPFATSVFGNRPGLWNQAEIQLQISVQRATSQPGIRNIVDADFKFLSGGGGYNTGPNRSPLSWLLGLGFLGIFVRHLRRDRSYIGVLVASLLSVAFFVTQSADPRFFVPALGILSVATAFVVQHPLARLRGVTSSLSFSARLALIVSAGVVTTVACLWSSVGFARMKFQAGNPQRPRRLRPRILLLVSSAMPKSSISTRPTVRTTGHGAMRVSSRTTMQMVS